MSWSTACKLLTDFVISSDTLTLEYFLLSEASGTSTHSFAHTPSSPLEIPWYYRANSLMQGAKAILCELQWRGWYRKATGGSGGCILIVCWDTTHTIPITLYVSQNIKLKGMHQVNADILIWHGSDCLAGMHWSIPSWATGTTYPMSSKILCCKWISLSIRHRYALLRTNRLTSKTQSDIYSMLWWYYYHYRHNDPPRDQTYQDGAMWDSSSSFIFLIIKPKEKKLMMYAPNLVLANFHCTVLLRTAAPVPPLQYCPQAPLRLGRSRSSDHTPTFLVFPRNPASKLPIEIQLKMI
jgi:hypothetical protein